MACARLLLALTSLLVACRGRVAPDGADRPGELSASHQAPAGEAEGNLAPKRQPTLADFWDGRASFELDVLDTGLPVGESDSVVRQDGVLWSYLHASFDSAGTRDSCGGPVPFPGCVVIFRSSDGGLTFSSGPSPTCQFECARCPCDSDTDHFDQQQYPRLQRTDQGWYLVYEYRGRAMLRRSTDGLAWGPPTRVGRSGPREQWSLRCPAEERIGAHPHLREVYDCLAGGPPGLFQAGDTLYVFMALGQNPGSMGCFRGSANGSRETFQRCRHNPLFAGATTYGPVAERGAVSNPYFDFRIISAAKVIEVGDGIDGRFYMLYEGIRGPGPGDPGDSQFGLGLARSLTGEIDGPWQKFSGNPILADLPGNVGLGHADIVAVDGRTFLYTSLDGVRRSRLALVWDDGSRMVE